MRVIIFGASGSLGSHVVQQALAKGYTVRAFTRHAEKLKEMKGPHLNIIQGDVNNFDDVSKTTKECCVPPGDGTKGKVRATGTKNIVNAMESLGMGRLVCQTTLGIGESWHNLNFFWKYIMFGFLFKRAFQDHELQEDYIRESDLNFTIIRPSAFTNGPSSRDFLVGFNANTRNLSLRIPRADIAYFMVEQLSSEKFIKKTISISN